MFVPLEVVDEMCAYMENRDLIGIALVCKHWHETCMRRVSTELTINMWEGYHQKCQEYLDHFNGHSQRPDIPTRPIHVKTINIDLNLETLTNPHTPLNLTAVYALLDRLSHVRCLELDAEFYEDQLDVVNMVCKGICVRLPHIKHLRLSARLPGDSEDLPVVQQSAYKHIINNYRLTTINLENIDPFDGAAVLHSQASTLVKLEVPLSILTNSARGFRAMSFPLVKRLTLYFHNVLVGDGHMLHLGKLFPSLEYLSLWAVDMRANDLEELGDLLQLASTSLRLRQLELDMWQQLKILPRISPITFSHLETLVLYNPLSKEHLELLASVQWPSLVSIFYTSNGVYPDVIPRLLKRMPKLKWLRVLVQSDPGFFSGLVEAFDQKEWLNLQGVCLYCAEGQSVHTLPDYGLAVQKACPNATIHITLKKEEEYDATLDYGINLSLQCGWSCYKCIRNHN